MLGITGATAFFWPDIADNIGLSRPFPSDKQLAEMRLEAENACKCARRFDDGDSKRGCWHRLDEMTGDWKPTAVESACAPVSISENCFDGSDRCYTSGYNLVAWSQRADAPIICTAEEARTFESIYQDAVLGPEATEEEAQRALAAADDAAEKAARDIAAGRPVKYSKLENGCTG